MSAVIQKTRLLWIIALLLAAQPAVAQLGEEGDVNYVPCEKYHRSFSVRFENLYVDKIAYEPGEIVKGHFDLVGAIDHPMVEGKVKIQVLTYFDTNHDFGEDIVDEFFLPDEISFKTYGRQSIDFNWRIPLNLPAGNYKFAFYYYMSSYSLGGHSDVSGLYSTVLPFEVKGKKAGSQGFVYFDRKNVFINDVQYNATLFLPEHEYGVPLTITVPLVNVGGTKNVIIEKHIYLWDDVKHPRLMQQATRGLIPEDSPIFEELKAVEKLQQKEDIKLGTNESKIVRYELGVLPPEAYMVKLIAIAGEQKTIMPIRVPVKGLKARIAFAAISNFPLNAGEEANIGACFSISTTLGEALECSTLIADNNEQAVKEHWKTTEYLNALGKITFELYDRDNKLLFKKTVEPIKIVSEMRAIEVKFKPAIPLSQVKLRTKLWDARGRLQDIEETYFDYAKFVDAKAKLKLDTSRDETGTRLNVELLYGDVRCEMEKKVNIIVKDAASNIVVDTEQLLLDACYGETNIELPEKEKSYVIKVVLDENQLVSAEAILEGMVATPKPSPTATSRIDTPGTTPTPSSQQEHTRILATVISVFIIMALLLWGVLRIVKRKRLATAIVITMIAINITGLPSDGNAAQIDGYQLFCPTTPYVADPACWESYVKAYLRIAWNPVFVSKKGDMLSGNVLYCEGEPGKLNFDINSSLSGHFMITGGYTSCPEIAWKSKSDFDTIASMGMFEGGGNRCEEPLVQPQITVGSNTWNVFCKGKVEVYEGGTLRYSFDVTSMPPSLDFNIPQGVTQYSINTKLYVDCLGYSGYFNGRCWNRPHPIKLNSYNRAPGPIGIPPYPNLIPATLESGVSLHVVDPNKLFNETKLDVGNITYTRKRVQGSLAEKVIARFVLTNNDAYDVKITSIEMPFLGPEYTITILQGNGVVLSPNSSTEVVIEVRNDMGIFPENPKMKISYSYHGFTISCMPNEGTKTVVLSGFPSKAYMISSLTASNTMVGGMISVDVKCTYDLKARVSMWPSDVSGTKTGPALFKDVEIECNKGAVEFGPINQAGLYRIDATLEIPGYACVRAECNAHTYATVYSEIKTANVTELTWAVIVLILIAAVVVINYKEPARD
jgi:hypothetical protein